MTRAAAYATIIRRNANDARFVLLSHLVAQVARNYCLYHVFIYVEVSQPGGQDVAVFEYRVTLKNREEYEERGTVVGRDEQEALEKLKRLDFDQVRLRKIGGISGIFKRLSADVK